MRSEERDDERQSRYLTRPGWAYYPTVVPYRCFTRMRFAYSRSVFEPDLRCEHIVHERWSNNERQLGRI